MPLYPDIKPFASGRLRVSDLHELYYEQVGTPDGKPAVFLHGGPGGGLDPYYRRFFDPARYHAVLFDQRGSGKSTPWASLEQNTTQDLIADIERLRNHLGIERWQVFGGSWGSTLALAYAEAHPDRVTELVLRGIFLLRRSELDWFYQDGASHIFPDAWQYFLAAIPAEERHDLLHAYHRRLTSPDRAVMLDAARVWSIWEASTSRLHFDPDLVKSFGEDAFAEAFARIEAHYFVNGGFLREGQLLDEVDRIRHIPCVIVQGRYDIVCPITSAWDLKQAYGDNAELVIVPDAGHSAREPGIANALVDATDKFLA
ncbi:MAG TPA: prolyl aminopeptidase [Dehalococcoidia bacterium]|nr:prolyl aminopeptidase [Dehalococcoidia bacterium]